MTRLILAVLAVLPSAVLAAVPGQDPDWPCAQRLVPQVTAETFWNGTMPAAGAEPAPDPRIAKLVAAAGPRTVSADDAAPQIAAFLKTVKPAERAAAPAAAFRALVDDTNRQRTDIIERIKELNRRQREIAALVDKVEAELASLPADAPGEAAPRRAEAVQRKTFLARTFEETRRTMRYACEVPAQLDARLGAFARALQAGAGPHS